MFAADAARTMVADARAFYEFGWLLGTSGNLSVRLDTNRFLITASGRDKGRLSEDDFLECDLSGATVVAGEQRRPSAETAIHCAIYAALADAGAVYHVHEPFSALCSDRDEAAGATVFTQLEMIKGLDIWDETSASAPIVPNVREIASLARAVEPHLGGRVPAVNILRHGFYAWGKTPFEAKRHVESLAYLYRISWELGRANA